MKILVIIFFIFLGYISYHLLTETSENADKELSRILTETDASELKRSFEEVVTREKKITTTQDSVEFSEGFKKDSNEEELFRNFNQTMDQDEIKGLNLARSYFFSPELSSEIKSNLFDEILRSDISEENKKYLSREILKGPSDPSVALFEKALRNYTASMLPEEKKETVNDLREIYRRREIKLILERFALDQGL